MSFWRGVAVLIGIILLVWAATDLLGDRSKEGQERPSRIQEPTVDVGDAQDEDEESDPVRRKKGGEDPAAVSGCVSVGHGLRSMLIDGLTETVPNFFPYAVEASTTDSPPFAGKRHWYVAAAGDSEIAVWVTTVDPTQLRQQSGLIVSMNETARRISNLGDQFPVESLPDFGSPEITQVVLCARG